MLTKRMLKARVDYVKYVIDSNATARLVCYIANR